MTAEMTAEMTVEMIAEMDSITASTVPTTELPDTLKYDTVSLPLICDGDVEYHIQ